MSQSVKERAWWALPALSGVLLGLAFPPFQHASGLAWIALVPLFFFLCRMPLKSAVAGGFAFVCIFNFISMAWMMVYGPLAYLGLTILILGTEGFIYLIWLKALCGNEPRKYAVWAPATWVFFEYQKTLGHWAFPWGHLGHSQWGLLPVVQTASIVGAYGVTYLVVFVNAGIYLILDAALKQDLKRQWKLALIPFVILAAAVGFGSARLRQSFPGEPITVAVVQDQETTKGTWDWQKSREVLDRYELLIAPLKSDPVDLVVLPESFAELPDFENPKVPGCPESDLGIALAQWMKGANFTLVYGAEGVENWCKPDLKFYNSFFLRDAKGLQGRVDKRRLVPFGEYIPMRGLVTKWLPQFPWGAADLQPGRVPGLLPFRLPGCAGKDCERPLGVVICFETLFPQDGRDLARKGARLLVSGTNSSWFSPPATQQMIRYEAFRPVETGLYMARAGTGGISTIIDPAGRFLVRLNQFETAEGHAPVTLREGRTFYVRNGDWFVWLAAALAFGMTALKLAPADRKP
ncbi:MAG: apolipoprotein N-acyltransferase [bacterium]